MKKVTTKKLGLNKTTVSTLNNNQMVSVKGGSAGAAMCTGGQTCGTANPPKVQPK